MDEKILILEGSTISEISRKKWAHEIQGHVSKEIKTALDFMSEDHHKVRNFVVEELPRLGKTLPPEIIAENVDLAVDDVNRILEELEKHLTFLFRNDQGAVAWAYPITVDITPHRAVFSTGEKKFKEFLNILRLFIGESQNLESSHLTHPLYKYREEISILETDVDDLSGELLGNFINKVGKEKVLDIQVVPSITKKNRPSNIIKILCYPKYAFELMDKIINELGTLGVRFHTINRVCIERMIEKQTIEIYNQRFEVSYKVSYIDSEKGKQFVNIKPEYEDLNRISEALGIPLRKIQFIVQTHLKQFLNNF